MIRELKKQSLYGLPTDTQGYFHRFTGRAMLEEAESATDSEEARQCLLATLAFIGRLVNGLQICRKTQIPLEEAMEFAQEWEMTLPWTETPLQYDGAVSLWSLSDFHLQWLKELPNQQLYQRDEGLMTLAMTLVDLFGGRIDVRTWSLSLFATYCNYIAYAVNQLADHWDTTALPYLAPLYHTGEVEKQSLGQMSNVFFHGFSYKDHLARPFALYHSETGDITQCYNKNAVLHPYKAPDFLTDCGKYGTVLENAPPNKLQQAFRAIERDEIPE